MRGFELPPHGDYAVAHVLLLARPGAPPPPGGDPRGRRRAPRPALLGWRDVPSTRGDRPRRARVDAGDAPALHRARCATVDDVRAHALHDPQARRHAARTRSSAATTSTSRRLSSRIDRLQGAHARRAARRRSTPTSAMPRCASRLAMVHSRFSTNTFPTWERAHPFRRIAHNGEINTLSRQPAPGWTRARRCSKSDVFGEHIEDFKPIIRPGGSDSASLDNVVDFLVACGRSLPHVMMMLVPEAWADAARHAATRRSAFYEYHALSRRAVGRAGGARLHRRRRNRRHARSQRPAAGEVRHHRRRARRRWRASSACCRLDPARRGREGARCSRARCSSSTPTPGASSPTRRSSTTSPRRSRIASGSTRTGLTLSMLPEAQSPYTVERRRACGGCSARSATRARTCDAFLGADGRRRRGAGGHHGRRHAAGGLERAAAARSSATSSSSSRRSRIRRSIRSARSSSCRS